MEIKIDLTMSVDQAKALAEALLMSDRTLRRLKETSLTDTVKSHWDDCINAVDYVDTKVQAALLEKKVMVVK